MLPGCLKLWPEIIPACNDLTLDSDENKLQLWADENGFKLSTTKLF